MFKCLNELYLPSTLLNDIEKHLYEEHIPDRTLPARDINLPML
jgi:hypothetical protein